MRQWVMALSVLASLYSVPAAADPKGLPPVTLEVGASVEIEDAVLVPASGGTSADSSVVSVSVRRITAVKVSSTEVRVDFTADGLPPDTTHPVIATVNVTVKAIEPVFELKRQDGVTVAAADENFVVSGDTLTLSVQGHERDGSLRAITAGVTIESSNDALIDDTGGKLAVKELPNGDRVDPPAPVVPVTVKLPGGTEKTLTFVVVERPAKVTVDLPDVLREERSTPIQAVVKGSGGGLYHSASAQFPRLYGYRCLAKNRDDTTPVRFVSVPDGRMLVTERLTVPDVLLKVQCSAFPVGRTAGETGSLNVTVRQSGGRIRLTPPTLSMFSGQEATVRAEVVDRMGMVVSKDVQWSIVGGMDGVVLAPQGGPTVVITASKDRNKVPESGVVSVLAKSTDADNAEISATLPIKIVNASGFTRVRGGLEMIDYQTAKDLYGAQTAEDFYVAKITLFNDLPNELAGASILVFSSSLGIGVNLQKAPHEFNKMKGSDVRKLVRDHQWKPLLFGDLRKLGLPLQYPLGRDDLPRPYPPGRPPSSTFDEQAVYTCDDVWYAEQAVQLSEAEEASPDIEKIKERKRRERDERVAAARLRQLRYRPYPYDMVIKSFDPRDNRTGRSLTFRALTFAGSLASFVTGVPNFGASKQFIAVNEKFASVLVPGLAALWPTTRENQRQNLVDDTMHPIEEIPYGSSLTKVIFLPKYPFPGLGAGWWYRISEICPYDFQVDVAISYKEKQVVPVTATPPSN